MAPLDHGSAAIPYDVTDRTATAHPGAIYYAWRADAVALIGALVVAAVCWAVARRRERSLLRKYRVRAVRSDG